MPGASDVLRPSCGGDLEKGGGSWSLEGLPRREENGCQAKGIGLVLLEGSWKWARARFGRGVLNLVLLPREWLSRESGVETCCLSASFSSAFLQFSKPQLLFYKMDLKVLSASLDCSEYYMK